MKRKVLLYVLSFFTFLTSASAHCPLCTAGVAAAAGGALWLGVQNAVVGLFVGAFAVSTGWWVSKLIKKQYIPYQKAAIIVSSFLLTVIPLYSLLSDIYPLYISWGGDYGSLFNRTYILNTGIMSTFLGGLIVSLTPSLSKVLSSLRRGKIIPFQGVILTLGMLIAVSALLQVIL